MMHITLPYLKTKGRKETLLINTLKITVMREPLLSLTALLCVSMTALAQNAQTAGNDNSNGQSNYSIVMNKDALTRMLSLTTPMADKMDNWQNTLQEKIDNAMTLESSQRSATLRTAIADALVNLKDMLGTESYAKYLTVFRSTVKNRGIQDLMK